MPDLQVLIVDPQPSELERVGAICEANGSCRVRTAASLEQSVPLMQDNQFRLIILSVPEDPAGEKAMIEQVRRWQQPAALILIYDRLDAETVRTGMRRGATDVLERTQAEELAASVRCELNRTGMRPAKTAVTGGMAGQFIGSSPGMQEVFQTIEQVAATNVDVLIHGETGTGKELVARAIHEQSPRADERFVPIDCGAIPENLLESEFFGYERGAFTGADRARQGLMEFANHGTFFLDEIGELPLLLQSKLLRTLQERTLRRVGGHTEVPVDIRIIAATARSLDQMVRDKEFREDLFYRINVVTIELPPLRDRGDDLGLLAEQFAERFSREMGKPIVGISAEAYELLSRYHWPGNVRELQNVIRRGIALTQGNLIVADDLPLSLTASPSRAAVQQQGFFEARDVYVREFELRYLMKLLERHQGNVKAAAEEAQLPRGTLYRLMKNHGIDGADYR